MDRIFEAYNGTMGAEFMHKTRERLHWICSQVWGSRVLDVGCSQGVVPIILARMGYAADGLDINPEAIAFANEQLTKEPQDIQSKVTYVAADFGKFVPPKDRTYDVITMSEVLEHLVRPQDFIRKAFSILPEKGRFIVTVPFGINDDPDHRQTFYLTSIYSLLHPFFEITGVKIFNGWIGLVGRRRAEETKEPPVIPLNLIRQAEEAFFKIERPLRDGTLAVRNQRQALKAEQEKLAEDLRAAEKARLEAEARVAAADTTPLRSELADVRGQLSVSEGEKQELQTSLEVERKASAGLQDQVSMLKAMLQFATSRPQDNAQETRLLEYSQEVRDLRTTLDRKRDEIAERAEQIGRLNGKVEYFEEANKRLLAERDKFQSDCESGKARVLALESELAEKARALSEVESRFADESKALRESRTEVGDLGDRAKTLEKQVREQTGRIEELEAELERRRSWTEQHKRESKDVRMQLFSVQNELAEKTRALTDAESRYEAESKAHQEALAKIDELDQQLETNAARSAAQSEQAAAQTAQAEAQAARIKELEAELAEQTKKLQENGVALAKSEATCATERRAKQDAQAQATDLRRQVDTLKAQEARLLAESKKLNEEKSALAAQGAAAEKARATIAKEANASAKALVRLNAKLAKTKTKLAKMEKRFDALSKSKLGRLTLKYWKFKDALSGRNKAKPKYSEVVPAASPAMALAERIRRLSNENYSHASICRFLKSVKVACIMDEFTWKSYSPEANMIQLLPESYEAQLNSFMPDLVFVESAWRGKDDKWTNSVHKIPLELKGILSWAKAHKVPTAFWNKEDPVHFNTFRNVASLFDFIFTYDFDCVQRYKEITGKDNAYFLPMAVQPTMFNPIEKYVRKDAFCFAGSYYRRYVERTKDLDGYIKAFPTYKSVEIFDRQYGKDNPNYMMPPEYAPYIKGNLPYDKMDKAYKGYGFSINLNSIKQANSIARRVFELLACNTITVSNYSRGVVAGFGDLVITSDNADVIVGKLKEYERRSTDLSKLKLLGLRKVFSENTYTDRFAYICSKVFGVDLAGRVPCVALVAVVEGEECYRRVRKSFESQAYKSKKLILISKNTGLHPEAFADLESALTSLNEVDLVGILSPEDFYGAHYLDDLVYAFKYAPCDSVVKGTFFTAAANGKIQLVGKTKPYAVGNGVDLRRGLMKVNAFKDAIAANKKLLSLDGLVFETSALSVDGFNYCEKGLTYGLSEEQVDEVSDLKGVNIGRCFSDLQKIAEGLQPIKKPATGGMEIVGERLFKCLSGNKEKAISIAFKDSRSLLTSTLGDDAHCYVGVGGKFKLSEIPLHDGKLNVQLVTDYATPVFVRLAYFFYDAKGRKLTSSTGATNENLTLDVPVGAVAVAFQLRLQKSGSVGIERLCFYHKPELFPLSFADGDVLCLTNHYPTYDNLYRNGFVHSRISLYSRQGLKASVFELSEGKLPIFSEFEGVQVVSGNVDYLRFVLEQRHYATILVHFLNEKMWSVVKTLPLSTRIVVWCHGSDILKYDRRLCAYTTEAKLNNAKQLFQRRVKLWSEVFSSQNPNLHLVFVSNWLKDCVEEDYGVKLTPDRYSIVSNPINTKLFEYRKKNPKQRYRILSIRPFASDIYANDLTVKCILELSKRSDFKTFDFTIIGDGPLFEQTVEPLLGFPNVHLQKRFLRQHEIAEYHRDNGIFLVPSRLDTQGVSRDEAMASGLVPITNAVAAIPEFVDKSCGALSPDGDYKDMVRQIAQIVDNPDLFLSMSEAAADSVRKTRSPDVIIRRELAIIGRGLSETERDVDLSGEAFIDEMLRQTNGMPESNGSRYFTRHKVKVGIVCDQFYYDAVKDAADFVYLSPVTDDSILATLDCLLMVSAWTGLKDGEWSGIAKAGTSNRERAERMIEVCRQHGIPTVFYSKEDPPNYDFYIGLARKCDHVFTSAEECIPSYKRDCGHSRVHAMRFCINPVVHNPVGIRYRAKRNNVIFSGSWVGKYPNRCRDLTWIFDGILASGRKLNIIDRNYRRHIPAYTFPVAYQRFVSPEIGHNDLQRIHRLFNWAVNINTVTNSMSMFANRVYELQACGNLLLSNYSMGVSQLLPTVFIAHDSMEVQRILNGFTPEEVYERQVAGVRRVMTGETCYDRVGEMLKTVGIKSEVPGRKVLVVAKNVTPSIRKAFERQSYANRRLIAESEVAASIYSEADIVAFFADDIDYGVFYLEDMVNAFKYVDCDYVTKDAYVRQGKLVPGVEFDYVDRMTDRFRTVFWRESFKWEDLRSIRSGSLARGFSIDHFNCKVEDVKIEDARSSDLTVVLPVCDNGWVLYGRSFASLRRSLIFDRMEVLLADLGSADESALRMAEHLADLYPNVQVLPRSMDGSACAASMRDRAFDLVRTPCVAFLGPAKESTGDCLRVMSDLVMRQNLDFARCQMRQMGDVVSIFDYKDSSAWSDVGVSVIRTEFLRKNGLRFGSTEYGGDASFCQHLVACAKHTQALPLTGVVDYVGHTEASRDMRVELLSCKKGIPVPARGEFVSYEMKLSNMSAISVAGEVTGPGIASDLEKAVVMTISFVTKEGEIVKCGSLYDSPKFGEYAYLTAREHPASSFCCPIQIPARAEKLVVSFTAWAAKGGVSIERLKVAALRR